MGIYHSRTADTPASTRFSSSRSKNVSSMSADRVYKNVDDEGVLLRYDGETAVETIVFELVLHVRYPREKELYHLHIWADRDTNSHPRLNRSIQVYDHQRPVSIPFTVSSIPYAPRSIHFWMYDTSAREPDGIVTQHWLASGKVDVQSAFTTVVESEVNLTDQGDATQATLYLRCVSCPQLKFPPTVFYPEFKNRYITTVRNTFMRFSADVYDYFVYWDTPSGEQPVLSFAALSGAILADVAEGNETLLRLLQIACLHVGIAEDQVPACDDAAAINLLSEMCTCTTRFLVYVQDSARESRKKNVMLDQWSRLGCFPMLGMSGYDCEDGAELVLEIFHVVKYLTTSHPALLRMQSIAKRYTPFLAIGRLRGEETDTPHALGILLDTLFARQLIDGEPVGDRVLLPGITLESTTYTDGVWRGYESGKASDASQDIYNCFEDGGNSDELWSTIVKARMPCARVIRDGFYRKITTLLCADYRDRDGDQEAIHLLLQDDKTKFTMKGVLGVNMRPCLGSSHEKLLRCSRKVMPTIAFRCKRREILQNCPQLPPSLLPVCISRASPLQIPDRGADAFHFDMRAIDYDTRKDQIDKAIATFARRNGLQNTAVTTNRFTLCANMEMVTLSV
jgi:hypothetical protein